MGSRGLTAARGACDLGEWDARGLKGAVTLIMVIWH